MHPSAHVDLSMEAIVTIPHQGSREEHRPTTKTSFKQEKIFVPSLKSLIYRRHCLSHSVNYRRLWGPWVVTSMLWNFKLQETRVMEKVTSQSCWRVFWHLHFLDNNKEMENNLSSLDCRTGICIVLARNLVAGTNEIFLLAFYSQLRFVWKMDFFFMESN